MQLTVRGGFFIPRTRPGIDSRRHIAPSEIDGCVAFKTRRAADHNSAATRRGHETQYLTLIPPHLHPYLHNSYYSTRWTTKQGLEETKTFSQLQLSLSCPPTSRSDPRTRSTPSHLQATSHANATQHERDTARRRAPTKLRVV